MGTIEASCEIVVQEELFKALSTIVVSDFEKINLSTSTFQPYRIIQAWPKPEELDVRVVSILLSL